MKTRSVTIKSTVAIALFARTFLGGTDIASAQQGLQLSRTRVTICNDAPENSGVKLIRFDDLELSKELCIQVINNNEEPIRMDLDLVDGAINEHGNIACYNRNHSETIGQFATNKSYHYTVPPLSTERFTVPLSRDLGTIGQFFGCAHYYLKSGKSGGMFQANIGSTKKFIIDIAGNLVSKVKLINPETATENQLSIEKKISRLKAILKIINEGNVGQKGTYSGSIDWMLGEPQSFEGGFFLQGGEETDIVEQLSIPRYAIFGRLSMTIKFDPESTLGYFDEHFSPPTLEQSEYTVTSNITNYLLILIILGVITTELFYLRHKKIKKRRLLAAGGPEKQSGSGGLLGSLTNRRKRKLKVLDGTEASNAKENTENSTQPETAIMQEPTPVVATPVQTAPTPSTSQAQTQSTNYYATSDSCNECQRPFEQNYQTPGPVAGRQSPVQQGYYPPQPSPMQGYNYQNRQPAPQGYSAGPGPISQPPQPERRMFHHPEGYSNNYDHRGMAQQQPGDIRNYRSQPAPYPPHQGQRDQYYNGPDGYY